MRWPATTRRSEHGGGRLVDHCPPARWRSGTRMAPRCPQGSPARSGYVANRYPASTGDRPPDSPLTVGSRLATVVDWTTPASST